MTSYLHRQTCQIHIEVCSRYNPPHTTLPNLCQYKLSNLAQPTSFRRRFNLMSAECEEFSADLDSNIEEVDSIPEIYEQIVEMVRMASRKHIP